MFKQSFDAGAFWSQLNPYQKAALTGGLTTAGVAGGHMALNRKDKSMTDKLKAALMPSLSAGGLVAGLTGAGDMIFGGPAKPMASATPAVKTLAAAEEITRRGKGVATGAAGIIGAMKTNARFNKLLGKAEDIVSTDKKGGAAKTVTRNSLDAVKNLRNDSAGKAVKLNAVEDFVAHSLNKAAPEAMLLPLRGPAVIPNTRQAMALDALREANIRPGLMDRLFAPDAGSALGRIKGSTQAQEAGLRQMAKDIVERTGSSAGMAAAQNARRLTAPLKGGAKAAAGAWVGTTLLNWLANGGLKGAAITDNSDMANYLRGQ